MFFDTLKVDMPAEITEDQLKTIALENELNFRFFEK